MKALTTLTAVAALVAGVSVASAQMSPTVKGGAQTQNKNAAQSTTGSGTGSEHTAKSATVKGGAETQNKNAAQSKMGSDMVNSEHKVFGKAKFCITEGRAGGLKCTYKTMASCEKAAKPKGATCSTNPSIGTTGAK